MIINANLSSSFSIYFNLISNNQNYDVVLFCFLNCVHILACISLACSHFFYFGTIFIQVIVALRVFWNVIGEV